MGDEAERRGSEVPTQAGTEGGRLGVATTATSDPQATLESSLSVTPGTILGGRYRIVEPIGAGGMGVVFLAEHVDIGKSVAVKMLGGEFSHKSRLVERFLQEARAASRIRHPNIVDITDLGHVREGVPYYVMEYLQGESLARRIERDGRIPWPVARTIMLQICAALQAAHDEGVIHRDMKPDNCFLVDRPDDPCFVKVLDFGIAKVITEGTSNSLTQTGAVMGTASYMSPEQAQSLELGPATDIYSAGVVLYEMLTGRTPFQANGFLGMLTKHLTERPPSLRKVAPEAAITPELDRAVLRALAKAPQERYPSAAAFADALRSIPERPRSAWLSRWPALAGGVGITAALGTWWLGQDRHRDRDPVGSDTSPPIVAAVDPEPSVIAAEIADDPPDANVSDPPPQIEENDRVPIDEAGSTGELEPASTLEEAPALEPTRRRLRPRTTERKTQPRAALTDEDVDTVLARIEPRLRACGQREGALPGTRVTVTFTVGTEGRVLEATAQKLFAKQPLGRCVAAAVRDARFPLASASSRHTRELVLGG